MRDESREGESVRILEGCINNAEALLMCSSIVEWGFVAVLLLDSIGTLHESTVGFWVEPAAHASVIGVFKRYFDDTYLL